MKKNTDIAGARRLVFLGACFLAVAAVVSRPPPAAGMDTRLVLATEQIISEMRANGELPPPPGDEASAPAEDRPDRGISSSGDEPAGPVPEAFEPVDLAVEAAVVPVDEPEPADLPAPEMKEILQRRVSLRYVDADIRVVLRSLARAYNFNVSLAPEVRGNVTLDFTNVRIIDALETILVDMDLGYVVTGDIIRVTTQEKIQQETAITAAREAAAAQRAEAEAKKRDAEEAAEPLTVEIFKLKFIDANDAREAIEPMLSPGRGKATVLQTKQFRGFQFEAVEKFARVEDRELTEFVRSRTLIVQDTPTVIERIRGVVERIDHKPPQILIDAKILEVPIDHEYRLGINWTQALSGWNVGLTDLRATFDKHYGSEHERVTQDSRTWGVERLDQQRVFDDATWTDERDSTRMSTRRSERISQQQIESGIPYQLDDSLQYRMSESLSSNVHNVLRERGYSESQSQAIFDNYLHNVASNLTRMATAGQTYQAVLNAADFNLMLSAMQTDSNVVILSNPRVIVHENYAAQIFVGRRYPILKTEFSGEGGTTYGGTEVDEWREIGITLKVIPQIRSLPGGGEAINMIVHPAVSDIDGFAFAYGPTGEIFQSSYPIISIREADTNVTISDGDTIVIGGLISSRTMDKVSKIPLLGDIPILGYLFKEEHTQVRKINLLIFITARIVTAETEFSAYEKMMLEKMPPEALRDVRYFDDSRVRPHLYLPPEPPEPLQENEEDEGDPESERDKLRGNPGNLPGRVSTRAMERSRR